MLLLRPLRWVTDLMTIAGLVLCGAWIGARLQTVAEDHRAIAADVQPYSLEGVSFAVTHYLVDDLRSALRAVTPTIEDVQGGEPERLGS
jgi:hypothetical protein